MVDPLVLASITSAVAVLGNEYLKGVASDAGKSTWSEIKSLMGWKNDPNLAEIPTKINEAMSSSSDIAERLVKLLKENQVGSASALVGRIEATGGKVVVANTIVTDHFQM